MSVLLKNKQALSLINPVQGAAGRLLLRPLSTKESYTERQAKLGRPVSPHVQIYAFPITALSSITVRVTGVAMACGFGGVGALAAVGADVPSLINAAQLNIPLFVPLSKFAVAFPISYHYLGGLRHLIWDNFPEALETAKVAQTSYGIFGAAGLFSLGTMLYTIKSEDTTEDKE